MVKERKVFLSLIGLMQLMKSEEISDEDFSRGLFFFLGCPRERVLEMGTDNPPREVAGVFATDITKGGEAFARLQRVLVAAEDGGRVIWPSSGNGTMKDELNDLLVANGARPVRTHFPPACTTRSSSGEPLSRSITGSNR